MNGRVAAVIAVLAAIVAAVAVATWTHAQSRPEKQGQARLFPDLAQRVNDAAAVELKGPKGSLRIERDGDLWVLPSKTGIAAQQDKVRGALVTLTELAPIEQKTSNPDNYARIKVDDPNKPGSQATLLTVTDAKGATLASIILGDSTWMRTEQRQYVRKPDEAQSWLVDGNIETQTDAASWMDDTLLSIDGTRIQSMMITHPDGEEFGISRDSADEENFTVEPIPEGRELRSPGIATPMSRALSKLTFEDVRPDEQPLDESKVTTVVYQTFDGLVIALRIGDENGARWTTVTASAADASKPPEGLEAIQAKVKGRQFELPAWAASNMTKHISDLLAAVPEPAAAPQPEPSAAEDDQPPLGPVLDPDGDD